MRYRCPYCGGWRHSPYGMSRPFHGFSHFGFFGHGFSHGFGHHGFFPGFGIGIGFPYFYHDYDWDWD